MGLSMSVRVLCVLTLSASQTAEPLTANALHASPQQNTNCTHFYTRYNETNEGGGGGEGTQNQCSRVYKLCERVLHRTCAVTVPHNVIAVHVLHELRGRHEGIMESRETHRLHGRLKVNSDKDKRNCTHLHAQHSRWPYLSLSGQTLIDTSPQAQRFTVRSQIGSLLSHNMCSHVVGVTLLQTPPSCVACGHDHEHAQDYVCL